MASTDLVEGISVDSLLEHIKILASDDFEGRAPGSRGEEKTIEYLTDQFSSFGLLVTQMVPGFRRYRLSA